MYLEQKPVFEAIKFAKEKGIPVVYKVEEKKYIYYVDSGEKKELD